MMILKTTEDIERGFSNWLYGIGAPIFEFENGNYYNAVIQIPKDNNFSYLYCQSGYREHSISANENFEYAGILCKKDHKVYDLHWNIAKIMLDGFEQNGGTASNLTSSFVASVIKTIESAVGNDRNNLQIKELNDDEFSSSYNRYISCDKPDTEARDMFLSGIDPRETTYRCTYIYDKLRDDDLLRYILDPAEYVKQKANEYLENHQNKILTWFMKHDAVCRTYDKLVIDGANPVHLIKKIMEAMANSPSAQQVTVTICKEGVWMTFKVRADAFRENFDHCDMYDIASFDRQKYEETFGRYTHFMPNEIISIKHGRSVLYET